MVLYVTTLGLCIFGLCEQNSSLAFDSITDLDFSLAWLPEAQNKKYSPPVLTGRREGGKGKGDKEGMDWETKRGGREKRAQYMCR